MNTERLLQLADLLVQANTAHNIQGVLDDLRNQLDQLAANPGQPAYHTSVFNALNALTDNVRAFEEKLTPADLEAIGEMSALPYFSSSLPLGIQSLMASAGVVPGVVRDRVVQLQAERVEFLSRLEELRRSLRALGVAGLPQPPGVEAGFHIPRALFNNTLDGLGKEFEQITKIIAVFAELATGSVEPLEVRQISTTDPLVIVGLVTPAAIAFSKAVDWVLETINKVLELKELYNKNKSAGVPDVVLEGMKGHIADTVEKALADHGKALVESYPIEDQARKNELDNHVSWAMSQLFAKVEQGMTVELRLLPPPPTEGETPQDAEVRAQTYADLAAIAKRLDFPKLSGEPLLALNGPGDGAAAEGGVQAAAQ